LEYGYLKIFEGIVKYFTRDNSAPTILHLGGGGYSLPRYIEVRYPDSLNDVVEIDPAVTQIAYDELGLPRETRITTYNQDARLFLSDQPTQRKYDIVVGDVFNDMTTPYHLTTLEFDRLVKTNMAGNGIYLLNIIDNYHSGQFLPAVMYTLKHAFVHVYLFTSSEYYNLAPMDTFVIAATDTRIDLEDFNEFISGDANARPPLYIHEEKKLEQYLSNRQPILLTDDYAPTDILVAPLFRLRLERK
jgi:spermidine synthase